MEVKKHDVWDGGVHSVYNTVKNMVKAKSQMAYILCFYIVGVYFLTCGFVTYHIVVEKKSNDYNFENNTHGSVFHENNKIIERFTHNCGYDIKFDTEYDHLYGKVGEFPFKNLKRQGNKTTNSFHAISPRFDDVTLIVIDSLRYDFMVEDKSKDDYYHNKMVVFDKLLDKDPENSFLSVFLADAPTSTTQRIIGLTSGTIPTYMEVLRNFGGAKVSHDSFVYQMDRKHPDNIYFFGDSSWSMIYPDILQVSACTLNDNDKQYMEEDYTTRKVFSLYSLNVNDIFDSDNDIKRLSGPLLLQRFNLEKENIKSFERIRTLFSAKHMGEDKGLIPHLDMVMKNRTKVISTRSRFGSLSELHRDNPMSPKGVFMHFFGLDHCSHKYGLDNPVMRQKTIEMNGVVTDTISLLNENSLFICFGDHGMTNMGEHGGDSLIESFSGLFLYSKRDLSIEGTYSKLINSYRNLPDGYMDADLVEKHGILDALKMDLVSYGNFFKKIEDLKIQMFKSFNHDSANKLVDPAKIFKVNIQVDIVPTMSILTDLPIPMSNIGIIIPELMYNINIMDFFKKDGIIYKYCSNGHKQIKDIKVFSRIVTLLARKQNLEFLLKCVKLNLQQVLIYFTELHTGGEDSIDKKFISSFLDEYATLNDRSIFTLRQMCNFLTLSNEEIVRVDEKELNHNISVLENIILEHFRVMSDRISYFRLRMNVTNSVSIWIGILLLCFCLIVTLHLNRDLIRTMDTNHLGYFIGLIFVGFSLSPWSLNAKSNEVNVVFVVNSIVLLVTFFQVVFKYKKVNTETQKRFFVSLLILFIVNVVFFCISNENLLYIDEDLVKLYMETKSLTHTVLFCGFFYIMMLMVYKLIDFIDHEYSMKNVSTEVIKFLFFKGNNSSVSSALTRILYVKWILNLFSDKFPYINESGIESNIGKMVFFGCLLKLMYLAYYKKNNAREYIRILAISAGILQKSVSGYLIFMFSLTSIFLIEELCKVLFKNDELRLCKSTIHADNDIGFRFILYYFLGYELFLVSGHRSFIPKIQWYAPFLVFQSPKELVSFVCILLNTYSGFALAFLSNCTIVYGNKSRKYVRYNLAFSVLAIICDGVFGFVHRNNVTFWGISLPSLLMHMVRVLFLLIISIFYY